MKESVDLMSKERVYGRSAEDRARHDRAQEWECQDQDKVRGPRRSGVSGLLAPLGPESTDIAVQVTLL